MKRNRQIEELEHALAGKIRNSGIGSISAGSLLRGLPAALGRSARFRAEYSIKQRSARRIRQRREQASGRHNWTPVSGASVGRFESLAAVVGDRLFLFSGFAQGERISGGTLVYQPTSDSWSSAAPIPVPVTHAGVAVEATRVWIIGGFIGDHPGVPTSRVQIYDTLTDSWREGRPLPVNRGSLAGTYAGGQIHAFGGMQPDRETDCGDHFTFDPTTPDDRWQMAAPMPEARNHLAGTTLDDLVYAVGGQRGHDGPTEDLALVHAYDQIADSWHRRADLPTARNHCEAAVFSWEGRVFVAGGYDSWRERAPHASIVRYDPNSDAWSTAGFLPVPLVGPVVQMVDGSLVASSGTRSLTGPTSDSTWIHRSPHELLTRHESGERESSDTNA